jgi:TIR domain
VPIPFGALWVNELYVGGKIWHNQWSSNGKTTAMATLYISYKAEDRPIAQQLSDALKELGHRPICDAVALTPGKDWRHVLANELSKADACVVLLNERSLTSPFVLGEIGAARALYHEFGRMLLAPVVLGDLEIPPVINDLFAVRMASDGSDHQRVAKEIGKAVDDHFNRLRMNYPRIFVSHRHKDVPVVEGLVSVIETAFQIQTHDLRCTSVHPYRLRAGERTSDRLRLELQRAEAVLGIVTPDTKDSTYVLFELGASWGRGGVTFPLLAFGASTADVPAPIGDLHTLDLSDEAECHQLIEDLSDVTTLNRRDGNGPKVAQQISKLATISRSARQANGGKP